MKYIIKRDSFVAYKSCSIIESEKYLVAFGHCGTLEVIQFIEIEYTDNGEIIHFYDIRNEKIEEKYKSFQPENSEKDCITILEKFCGNEKLNKLLDNYKKLGCDYVHEPDCRCVACENFKGTIYRGDTICRVIAELSKF